MLRLQREQKQLKLEDYARTAVESDYDTLLDEPFELRDASGKLRAVYLHLEESLTDLRRAVEAGHYGTRGRTGGLKTRSATFGSGPRNSLFHDYCKQAVWAAEDPRGHATLVAHAVLVARHYAAANKSLYEMHAGTAAKRVLPEWLLGGTPFTSGIVNESAQLAYHFDRGNFRDVWSGMITLRRGVEGGALSLPEFGLGVACRDRSLLLFDGQGVMHGVTPIVRTRPDGKRYTIVYYSLQQVWNCLSVGQELSRARTTRDAREKRRATMGAAEALRTAPRIALLDQKKKKGSYKGSYKDLNRENIEALAARKKPSDE